MNDISVHSRLIAALAENMKNSDWSSDIFSKCILIEEELAKIRKICRDREGRER